MLDFNCEGYHDINDFVKLVAILRGENGCPWDMVQTHESIRQNCIEEAYEVCEAIDEKNPQHLKEELGDLLMQVIFHAGIEEEAGNFNFSDVCDGACKKLIYRHPHVFGDRALNKGAEAAEAWERAKRLEHGHKSTADAIDGVAKTLPGLWRAQKILRKASGNPGFDPGEGYDLQKSAQELLASAGKDKARLEDDFGRLMFAALRQAETLGIDGERALEKYCNRFAAEFRRAEEDN